MLGEYMGTLGEKIGFGAGIFLAPFLGEPVVHLIPGSCFFEADAVRVNKRILSWLRLSYLPWQWRAARS
jgi:hypothetical protein